uniref:Putative secreted protein n=1 Tax=Anopheles darlingi TaxID=43151 RepID=A0A2M4DFT0_ANODA
MGSLIFLTVSLATVTFAAQRSKSVTKVMKAVIAKKMYMAVNAIPAWMAHTTYRPAIQTDVRNVSVLVTRVAVTLHFYAHLT